MKITVKQLKELIKESIKECGLSIAEPELQDYPGAVVVVGEPEIKSGLFPGMSTGHEDAVEHGIELDHGGIHGDQHEEKAMIISNLNKLADKAVELRAMAAEVPDNEEWVQEKIAVASAMIDSIYNYLKYTDEQK